MMAGAVDEAAAVRVYADYAGHATPTEVLPVIDECRNDLDTPSAAALPELIERLTRQRLTDPDRSASPWPRSRQERHVAVEAHMTPRLIEPDMASQPAAGGCPTI